MTTIRSHSRWSSLAAWRHQLTVPQCTVVNRVIATLVVVGGIGWRVINDVWVNRQRLNRLRCLSLHTRLVLRSTAALIVVGCLGLLFTESFASGGAMEAPAWWQRLQVTLFPSISARTAGFNTVPLSVKTFSDVGLLLLIVLMFVGRLDILLLLSALFGSRPQPRVGYPREELYI